MNKEITIMTEKRRFVKQHLMQEKIKDLIKNWMKKGPASIAL